MTIPITSKTYAYEMDRLNEMLKEKFDLDSDIESLASRIASYESRVGKNETD